MRRVVLFALCLALSGLLAAQESAVFSLGHIPFQAEAAGMTASQRTDYAQFAFGRIFGIVGPFARSQRPRPMCDWNRLEAEVYCRGTAEALEAARVYLEGLEGLRPRVAQLDPDRLYAVRYTISDAVLSEPADLAARLGWARTVGRAAAEVLRAATGPRGLSGDGWEGALDVVAEGRILVEVDRAVRAAERASVPADLSVLFGVDSGPALWLEAVERLADAPRRHELLSAVERGGEPDLDLLAQTWSAVALMERLPRARSWWAPTPHPTNPFAPVRTARWLRFHVAEVAAAWRLHLMHAAALGDRDVFISGTVELLAALDRLEPWLSAPERFEAAAAEGAAMEDLRRWLEENPGESGHVVEGLARASTQLPGRLNAEARNLSNLLLLRAALGGYYRRYGFFPPSLVDLSTGFLDSVPSDPVSGRDYVYQRLLGGYRLYSVADPDPGATWYTVEGGG